MKRCSVLVTIFTIIAFPFSLFAATPGNGTLTPSATGGASSISWTGGPYTGVTADPSVCTPLTCDEFFLTVNIDSSVYTTNPDFSVRVHISWADTPNDFDLYVYDASGNLVNSSAQGNTTFEETDLGQLTSGTYRVQVVAFTTVNELYSGIASVGPPPVDQERLARYRTGKFSFTQPKEMLGPNGVVFGVQDLEPRSAYDTSGNIYVAAIQGIPAGTDVWKSTDAGTSFTYLGQPDGAQAASAMAGRTPGAGGGDEDIAVGSTGKVYVTSLWLGSVTMSNSFDGGTTWLVNPVSTTVPLDDRQWIAPYKDNEVYLTFKQLGVLLTGTESIFVLKSFDGGLTFPQITEATVPEFGVQPDDQGNIAVDQNNGNVYTVFIGHPGNSVYVARSTDGGKSFTLLLVHQGPVGVSYQNVFPIVAVDRGSNVHVVYSNGTNVYLTSSSNQGTGWTAPVRVNNGMETKTALSPWIDAGDAGKVDIMWWATPSANSLASDAQWKVYFAQTQNAFAKTPTISENAATGVFHTGPICVNGTGCASGTRDLAEYASTTVYQDGTAMIVYPDNQQTSNPLTYFVKQTSGPVVISSQPHEIEKKTAPQVVAARVPDHFALEQNYPNPFNPSTTISYALPTNGFVQLTVYNLLGQEVSSLVNEQKDAGVHSVRFDASQLPSGVYFYKLVAEEGLFVNVKRMVIMK